MSKALPESATGKNWYRDRYQRILVQRKLLTLITFASLICTLVMAIVIAQLTPLKSVEPFVIQVDQKSGITQTVDPLTVQELTANEAVNNFFIVAYIRARETYDYHDLVKNYNIVRIMSDRDRVYPTFMAEAEPNNPRSNAARLGTSGLRTVKFQSIIYLPTPRLVQVHALIEEKIGGSLTQYHKIITLGFEYIKLQLNPEDRYINPLGFRVTNYRVDEETAPR
jgi:type IV secretion system protein VirB8